MESVFKFIIASICFIAVFSFCSNMAGAFIINFQKNVPIYIQAIIINTISLISAFFVAKFVWKRTTLQKNNLGLAGSILMGGFLLGSIGFIVGFFGPIIFYPSSNQGPLFGIFISGPIGFLIGLVSGALYWITKTKK